MTTPNRPSSPTARSHRTVALAGVVLVSTMFGAAFAAVPLYDWFCRVTGIGGTTQVATEGPVKPIDRMITVRFDANVRHLPWTFTAPQPVTARIGEVITVTYTVHNTSSEPVALGAVQQTGSAPAQGSGTVGTATYNVVPLITGSYFNKMQCFCFTEQHLTPGQTLEMPVVFFVDPAIVADKQAGTASTITLSYTFYPVTQPKTQPLAQIAPQPAARL
jgi:cytochrome c oxidase assembly protein subunit 11